MSPRRTKPSGHNGGSPRFRVGDRVKMQFGARPVIATVIEDRGMLGVGGRQIIRVRVDLDPPYFTEFEVPASNVQAA